MSDPYTQVPGVDPSTNKFDPAVMTALWAEAEKAADKIVTRNIGVSAASWEWLYGRDDRAIQAAVNSLNGAPGNVIVPPGATWKLNSGIKLKKDAGLVATGAVVQAMKPMLAMVETPDIASGSTWFDTAHEKLHIDGGAWYGEHLADHNFLLRHFKAHLVQNLQLYSSLKTYITAGTDSAQPSYGGYIRNIVCDRPRPAPTPAGHIGLDLYATDMWVTDVVIVSAATGMAIRGGGSHFKGVQVWPRIPESQTYVAFWVFSSNHTFTDCMADTPSQYGWVFANNVWQITMLGCRHFNNANTGSTDNVVTSVKFEGDTKRFTCVGLQVIGSNGRRILRDFQFQSGANLSDFYITGTVYAYTTNLTQTAPVIDVPDGMTLDIQYRRNQKVRWFERFNLSDDRQWVSRKDDGSYSHNAITLRRLTRYVIVALGLAQPTNSDIGPGEYTSWVNEAENRLKMSYRPLNGSDTSVRTVSLGQSLRVKNENYAIMSESGYNADPAKAYMDDDTILVMTPGVTITLPHAVSYAGRRFTVKHGQTSGVVILAGGDYNGIQQIDRQNTVTINAGESVTVQAGDGRWWIVAKK